MNARDIRKTFLEFFAQKKHQIVPSAPMVLKDDPTLMFTNAGMNQFKDLFLGNSPIVYSRIADSQKCLRVSGKHNDLEEVGHDTYHHTMFEMLGNWSFGDYFKQEAIDWAWELLTDVYKIDKERLYATVFEGSKEENVPQDTEALEIWKKHLPMSRILTGNKKDNFWEMGDTGPCGPCSEVHIDLRSNEERAKVDGATLVNKSDPEVIEIWNLVFIQFNRKADGSLEQLPKKHVDTGMGFERLCRVIQLKTSNYDSDVFQPIIQAIALLSNKKYGAGKETDIAMRVIADHIRTISFAIADGQLPSNNKAGYVIRRILRRAIRYSYTFLEMGHTFMAQLIEPLIQTMGDAYPELVAQKQLIERVITQEEEAFLHTLEAGIKSLDKLMTAAKANHESSISGKSAFELYDAQGFPLDLTQLILRENNLTVNLDEFNAEMQKQKERARNASAVDTDDWVILNPSMEVDFVGYDMLDCDAEILRYRKITQKKKEFYQIVLNRTPFYAESGGQVGDSGWLVNGDEKIEITDTKKENNLIIHFAEKMPSDVSATFTAKIDSGKRKETANNHSATHLLHAALRQVLGNHVEQKGSLVNSEYLRFDFSHFSRLTDEEINKVETIVNQKIRENIALQELRSVPMEKAKQMGAMALFGEKYGDSVRVISFNPEFSTELCGGTHVKATGQIGLLKITSESAIAAGIRRIEAITGAKAFDFLNENLKTVNELKLFLKSPQNLQQNIEKLMDENAALRKQVEVFEKHKLSIMVDDISKRAIFYNGVNLIAEKVDVDSPAMFKDLSFRLNSAIQNPVIVLGAELNGKANISLMIDKQLVASKNLNAGKSIREIAKEIQGGGGGQDYYATAGGNQPENIDKALQKAIEIIKNAL